MITAAIITNANITTSYSNVANINTGIITSAIIDSEVVTNSSISTSYTNRANINVGVITAATITNANVTTSYTNQANINTGIVTTAHINTAYIGSANINIGFATYLGVTTSLTDRANINVGVITSAGITTATIDRLNVNTGVATYLDVRVSYSGTSYVNTGIITNVGITSGSANLLYLNAGIATYLGITSSVTNEAKINAGIITNANITTATVNTLNVNSGIATYLGITTAVATAFNINTAYINSGIITSANASSLIGQNVNIVNGNVDNLNATLGFVTHLSATNINVSGISTLGNVRIGTGNTSLVVTGNARITGILTIGSSSVTINGNNNNVSGVNSITGNVGVFTNVQVSGINTFTSLRNNVTFKTSQLGIATNYDLVLPPTLGQNGQLLGLNADGTLGFATGTGLYENRYYVSSVNGDDANDGKTLPVKTIKRASQLASFDSFIIPGQRYLDAGNLIESNKEFIKEEVVAYLEFNYEDISTRLMDYDPVICKRDIGYLVDALAYDIRFGGNSKSREAGLAYWSGATSYVAGEEEEAIFAYEYIKFLGQYIINNQSPPTLYQTAVSQTFDFTIIDDPENTNTNYFHRSKDARNLIIGNRQEIIDKSLASVALAATTGFYFPGEQETNERSRYYDSYKLIQINKQEIVDKSIASIAIGFPTGFYVPGPGVTSTTEDSRYYDAYRLIQINKSEIVATALTAISVQYPTLWSSGVSSAKCQRDLGYFVDAVSTDVFTGGNNYARAFTGFYFVGVGTTSLAGEEQQTIYGFQQAGTQMRRAITNLLTNKNLNVSSGPETYNGGGGNVGVSSTTACTDVQNTIVSLVGIVTAAIGVGNTSGLPAVNYGDFDLDCTLVFVLS